ncbi:hypothetical protein STVIR_7704 [Streptomyces viridochromogenes Tue57]|uniref:Uncharacterized protein n=1 Tax=Streptomyces viridochromogenes Tue57 TaxID=1160705 RepID=L8P4A8_STRVR|nr:hypothetical protein STVIR_7704 [Streptomyces viridochromogenes Tue57]
MAEQHTTAVTGNAGTVMNVPAAGHGEETPFWSPDRPGEHAR